LARILEFTRVKYDALWSAAPDLTTHGGHLIKEQQQKRAADIIPAK
jgi:hypothetical protein